MLERKGETNRYVYQAGKGETYKIYLVVKGKNFEKGKCETKEYMW